MHLIPAALIAGAIFSCAVAAADPFPEPYNSEPAHAQPPTPEESLAMLDLPAGFRATLFAAEPDVRNPIAAAWDHRGRLWVAENFTYAESAKRFDLDLRDRVLILEDTTGDGRADQRRVFTDKVRMLTSVEVGRGGVWLMCPPQLLFIPDADGDDQPDGDPVVVLDGFTVAQSNYHNFANGLRWGPDGWLYGRCGHSCPGKLGPPGTPDDQRAPIKGGIWRYHPERNLVEVVVHGTTNPWGHDWDTHGEGFFINVVNGHLWHLIPGAHYKESFGQPGNPHIFERLDTHADHWHFDTGKPWHQSRDGAANDFGGGHAHVGMMIYQGDQWPPDDHGKLFTFNLHGRRTNVERLERHGSGFIGRHEPDRFATADTWFRGIELTTGPDGAGYLLDWSDTGECHDHTGVHRSSGRIFKISYGDPRPLPDLADLETLTPGGSERLLRHPNVWYERQLRSQLHRRGAESGVVAKLREIAANPAETPVHRLRALWACQALDAADVALILPLLDDASENLRAWAVRLLTDGGPIDTITGRLRVTESPVTPTIHAKLAAMAADDPSGLVKLSLASAMQRLPLAERAVLAAALVADPAHAADHNLPAIVWYGLIPLAEADPAAAAAIAARCRWPDTLRWIARHAAGRLASDPQDLGRLLTAATGREANAQLAILRGITEGLAGSNDPAAPPGWLAFSESVATATTADVDDEAVALLRALGGLFGERDSIGALKAIALDPAADTDRRREAMRALTAGRPPDLRGLAAALLEVPGLAGVAAAAMADAGDPETAELLCSRLPALAPAEVPGVVDVLVQRPAWSAMLLRRIAAGDLPRHFIAAHHARQIRHHDVPDLTAELTAVWGELRDSPADARREIAMWKSRLTPETLAAADLARGKTHYAALCAACHRFYGEGGDLGPDLTGSGRTDLDYLLQNIIDPNAAVSADHRITLLTLGDGRTLAGSIAAETDRLVTLRQPAGETTVARDAITKRRTLPQSIMPEGLLTALDPDAVRDLIAYLMHPR
jgi:putative membrane-bound dehydrogenase-like protein